MIANLKFCLLVLIISGLSSVFAAEWSEWMDITHCSSKPCKCHPDDLTPCDSNGRKAQIRQCIRGKGEIDTCKGGGPFRLYTGCNNKNRCPGWSEWSVVSECDCTTNERKVERLCNNPAPIHPEVLCLKFDSEKDTKEESSERCQCSADQSTKTATTPKGTSTDPPTTTELPWCCEMFKVVTDEPNAGGDNVEDYDIVDLPICKEADDYFYSMYDESICKKCSFENGYCKQSNGTDIPDIPAVLNFEE